MDTSDSTPPDDPLALNPTENIDSDMRTQEIILAAAHHDIPALRSILNDDKEDPRVKASCKDPETGYTPLHAAVASLAPALTPDSPAPAPNGHDSANEGGSAGRDADYEAGDGKEGDEQMERAVRTAELLLQNGAVWNELDANDETPGCMAWRLGLKRLYEVFVEAGVRAELLFGRLDRYQVLTGGPGDEDEDEVRGSLTRGGREEVKGEFEDVKKGEDVSGTTTEARPQPANPPAINISTVSEANPDDLKTPNFLSSSLTFTADRILDASQNAVMVSKLEKSASAAT